MASLRRSALALVLVLAGCASTKIVNSWRDTSVSSARFSRILVVAPASDPQVRRAAEDELARRIVAAEPSYPIVTDEDARDPQLLHDQARAHGYDGLVLFRIVAVDRETVWTPGAYWGPAYAMSGVSGFGPGLTSMYQPSYVSSTLLVRVDTDLVDLREDKLVWAGQSKTYNPRSIRRLVADVTRAVGERLRRDGLL